MRFNFDSPFHDTATVLIWPALDLCLHSDAYWGSLLSVTDKLLRITQSALYLL